MDAKVLQFPAPQEQNPSDQALAAAQAYGQANNLDLPEAIVESLGTDPDHAYERLLAIDGWCRQEGSFEAVAKSILTVVVDKEPGIEITWINTLAALESEYREDFEGLLNAGYVPKDLPPNVIELPFPAASESNGQERTA